ncbi:YcbK family protein [Geopseudomonas aromaticivorans]
MATRRQFLSALASGAALIATGAYSSASSAAPDWRLQLLNKERVLRLHRRSSKETATLCYWRPGSGWDAKGYAAACHLLRDVSYQRAVQIDARLLDTLYIMQAWLAAFGRHHEIHILSGYRTPEHNSKLEGAAKNSLHLQGRAADILIPGLPTQVVGDMGRMISAGGVGFYPSRGFIHVDSGNIRTWRS